MAVESGLMNGNMKRFLEEMERLLTIEERVSGRQPRSKRRPTSRLILDVNGYTEKGRRRENSVKKHFVVGDRDVAGGVEELDVALCN